ncbi:hypothetical protein NEMBOFW57_009032 [Staphylotrichum longicolle]|uniref:Acyltransferase 3 domain-containing protein n=1 Tax=Staphylotrichum longicolle TaxID=669026 RepID=A0AAD4ES98_9PEZI|nr:hypothetical protein NEMBOFW57_009032 [Staphylotrichum longicolle]
MSAPKTRSSGDQNRAEHGGLLDSLELVDLEALSRPDTSKPRGRASLAGLISWLLSLILRAIRYPPPGSLRLRRTSWLDGVRGVAAMAVFIFHAMGCWAPLVPAWHADKDQTSLLQLPLIRTIFVSGGGAVSVFFVLSGYVLTHRCLGLIRAGSARDVYPAVASSAFRRGFRLYLPPIALTFCEMLMTRFGFAPPLNFSFKPEPTLLAQFLDWLASTNRLINPLHNLPAALRGTVAHPKYDAVIWTIPVEFYGSLACYALLALLARSASHTRLRLALLALLPALAMVAGSWNLSCFTAGMLLADLNLGQDDSLPPNPDPVQRSRRTLLWSAVLALSFYVAGFPTLVFPSARADPMPGFETLRARIPAGAASRMEDPARFWWSVAGAALLWSVSQLPRVKAVFETYLCQYLAKVSFALYLVHEFCIVLFGLRLQGWLMWLFGVGAAGQEKGVWYWVVCVVWFVVFGVPVFAVAAQVERWVDVPSVRFAKGVEERCLRAWKKLRA